MLWWFLLNRRFMRGYLPEISTVYGFRLDGRITDSNLNKVVFYRALFEPSLSDMIVRCVKPGSICIDLGANTGYFTLLMAGCVGTDGKVIAVEASPGNIRRLRANLAANQLDGRVEVRDVACGDRQGSSTFYVNRVNDMHCRLELPHWREPGYWLAVQRWSAIEVAVETLATIAGERCADVSFIKIDIEGMEHRIARSVVDLFTHPELVVAVEATQPNVRETLQPFEEDGFFAYDLQNDYSWVVSNDYKPARQASFAELYARRHVVDVVLSRCPIDLGAGAHGGSEPSH